jgi:hypothetical protein
VSLVGEDKHISGPFERVFHASLLLLGAVVALNLALAFLRPLLPWIAGAFIVGSLAWITVVLIRWRRMNW